MEIWQVTVTEARRVTRIVLGCEEPARTLFHYLYQRGEYVIVRKKRTATHPEVSERCSIMAVTLRKVGEIPQRVQDEKDRAELILTAVFPDEGTFKQVAP